MVWLHVLTIFIGLFFLIKSANYAIQRMIRISRRLGFSEYVVSFVLVGVIAIFPEFAIGVNSAIEGTSSFGLGVVFGSNVADLTLIVGLVALSCQSMRLHREVIKKSGLLLLMVLLPVLLLLDGEISRIDGLLLLTGFCFYFFNMVRSQHPLAHKFGAKQRASLFIESAKLAVALAIMFVAGHFIASAAEQISIFFALPIFFIGTVVAVGTCMPELSFAMQASNRKHAELGFGDILGNVFADCTATTGVIALISPIKPEQPLLALSSGFSMVLGLIIIIILFNYKRITTRKYGIYLILLYFVFLILQFFLELGLIRNKLL